MQSNEVRVTRVSSLTSFALAGLVGCGPAIQSSLERNRALGEAALASVPIDSLCSVTCGVMIVDTSMKAVSRMVQPFPKGERVVATFREKELQSINRRQNIVGGSVTGIPEHMDTLALAVFLETTSQNDSARVGVSILRRGELGGFVEILLFHEEGTWLVKERRMFEP